MKRQWNRAQKWKGNLVPALFWFPPTLLGVALGFVKQQFLFGALFIFIGIVVGLVALNYTGLWENNRLKKAAVLNFQREHPNFQGFAVFVGFARAGYGSALDPHEDVGMLALLGNTMVIRGEHLNLEVENRNVKEIGYAGSIHSLIFLGGWIKIVTDTQTIYVEPREYSTLSRNNRFRKKMVGRLQNWRRPGG